MSINIGVIYFKDIHIAYFDNRKFFWSLQNRIGICEHKHLVSSCSGNSAEYFLSQISPSKLLLFHDNLFKNNNFDILFETRWEFYQVV